jgi:TM2 domain-containing membrane protein YozV
MIEHAILKTEREPEFIAGVKTKTEQFAIAEFSVPQSSSGQVGQAQIAIDKTALDKFYFGKVGAGKIAIVKGAVVILTLFQWIIRKIDAVVSFIFNKDLFHFCSFFDQGCYLLAQHWLPKKLNTSGPIWAQLCAPRKSGGIIYWAFQGA